MSTPSDDIGLRRTLTTPKIVFLVIAAAAPLAAMVGTVPLAFAIGDGPGFPAMFVFAGLTLLCFSVGYAAMSRRIVNTGGFYTFIASGLGKLPAVGGGLIAVIAYNAVEIGLVGAFGYFAQLIASQYGLNLPWELWAGACVIAVAVLGYRQIDLSARVLCFLMVAEIGVLAVLDAFVIGHKGGAALPLVSMSPGTVLTGGVGVSLMFAFISYIGFESAALYGEETRNPKRSIPVATYLSVLVITVFYALTSWVAVGAVGADKVQAVAGKQLGNLFFGIAAQHVGSAFSTLMEVMLCTSLFAATLALHNAANRYMFALGRERVLPRWLGKVHLRHQSPHRASIVQTVVTVIVVAVFAIAGLDPYVNLATTMLGLGTLGIIVLQAGAGLATVAYFARREGRHWWRTIVAPLLGVIGLVTAGVLVVGNFDVLTGSSSPVVDALPWLLVVVAAAGIVFALWLRVARPDRYANLAAVAQRTESPAAPELTPVSDPA